MAFLLRERKDVLLEVAKELRVEIDITLPKIEFKKRICQSKYYDEDSVKCLLEGILEEKREEREKQEIKKFEERRLAREFELERLRVELRNKLNENELKAWNRINNLKQLYFVRKSHRRRDQGVENPEGLIRENICEEKYTVGTLMGCEKQLTMNRESFRNHTIAKKAGQLNGGKENMCKADVWKGLEDGRERRGKKNGERRRKKKGISGSASHPTEKGDAFPRLEEGNVPINTSWYGVFFGNFPRLGDDTDREDILPLTLDQSEKLIEFLEIIRSRIQKKTAAK
ncbi:hypothetical protein TNCV_3050841 [Trichonephila clavipes]|nr:hypothetical protein TNCV_3050841 [Trichonephila clavipes]